ncbi:MAG: hypothetical protein Q9179_004579, partial [Wetmoreana sp. 5 TL-2023]
FNVLVVPSSVIAVELSSKCLHALGYLAVFLTWVILLREWIINPATKLYRLLAKIIDQASGAVSEWYEIYLDSPLYDLLQGVAHALTCLVQIVPEFLALKTREYLPAARSTASTNTAAPLLRYHNADANTPTPPDPETSDPEPDQASSATPKHGTMVKGEDYVCPWNDSGIYVVTESSVIENNETEQEGATAGRMSTKDHCLEGVTASQESTLPGNSCQALVLYKAPDVNGLLRKTTSMMESEPNVTPSKPLTFRDSITLRHEQLGRDHSDKHRYIIPQRRTPKVKQSKETPTPEAPPTLLSYSTTPGKYSKDLEKEFADFGVSRIEVSPPDAIYGAGPLTDEENVNEEDDNEEDSLIIIV